MFSALWKCSPGAHNKTWDSRTSPERSSKPRAKKRRELAARTKNTRRSLHEDTFYVAKITQQCVSIVICTAEPQKLGDSESVSDRRKERLGYVDRRAIPAFGLIGTVPFVRRGRTVSFHRDRGRPGSSLPNCPCRAKNLLSVAIFLFFALLLHHDDSHCGSWSRPQASPIAIIKHLEV